MLDNIDVCPWKAEEAMQVRLLRSRCYCMLTAMAFFCCMAPVPLGDGPVMRRLVAG